MNKLKLYCSGQNLSRVLGLKIGCLFVVERSAIDYVIEELAPDASTAH